MSPTEPELIAAVEIGTAHIRCLIAEVVDSVTLQIVGHAEVSSMKSVEKGDLVLMPMAEEQLTLAMAKAEEMAKGKPAYITVSLSGSHLRSEVQEGFLPIPGGGPISNDELVTVTSNARHTSLPNNQELISDFTRSFAVDGRPVKLPTNMHGHKLTCEVILTYGERQVFNSVRSLIEHVHGDSPASILPSPFCAAMGVTDDDDREGGILVIDLGAGTTDYSLWHGNNPMLAEVLCVGVNHVSNDVSLAFNIAQPDAQRLLQSKGGAISQKDGSSRRIELPTHPGQAPRLINQAALEVCVELRLREIFEVIAADIHRHGLDQHFPKGIILCGGGAHIRDLSRLAQEVFNCPVRVGRLSGFTCLETVRDKPAFAACAGALKLGHLSTMIDETNAEPSNSREIFDEFKRALGSMFGSLKNSVKF